MVAVGGADTATVVVVISSMEALKLPVHVGFPYSKSDAAYRCESDPR